MDEDWYSFPAQMDDRPAYVTFNNAFAKEAKVDRHKNHIVLKATFKQPTEYGMPAGAEHEILEHIDNLLEEAINSNNGVYVGHVTIEGHRYYHYYVNLEENDMAVLVNPINEQTDYMLEFIVQEDPEKNGFWNDLYPTDDEWRIIHDMEALDELLEAGDIRDRLREVFHWAGFDSDESASDFQAWLEDNSMNPISTEKEETRNRYIVHYSHTGTMDISDLMIYTLGSNRKASELGGTYEGWETTAVKE
ncbi:MAG: DUF695 domain-containing protein [Leptospirales bacterium]